MAVLFIDVYRHIKIYILFGDIPCSIYLCKRKWCDFSINTFINDFPQTTKPAKVYNVSKNWEWMSHPPTPCLLIRKEGLWRVVYRNNIRLRVRTHSDYWCLNKPRCIVSSVFISTFFNVNLDETVNTHTHTPSTREFCTCVHLTLNGKHISVC